MAIFSWRAVFKVVVVNDDLNLRILSDAGLALGFNSTDEFMKFIAHRIQSKYQDLINKKSDLPPPNPRPEAV